MSKCTILTHWQLRYFDWEEMFCTQSSFFMFLYFNVSKISSQKTSFDRCFMTAPWRLHGRPQQSQSQNTAKVGEKGDLSISSFFLKTACVFYWKLLPTSLQFLWKMSLEKTLLLARCSFLHRASPFNDKCADGSLAQVFTAPNLQSTQCPQFQLTSGGTGMYGTNRTQVSLGQQRCS